MGGLTRWDEEFSQYRRQNALNSATKEKSFKEYSDTINSVEQPSAPNRDFLGDIYIGQSRDAKNSNFVGSSKLNEHYRSNYGFTDFSLYSKVLDYYANQNRQVTVNTFYIIDPLADRSSGRFIGNPVVKSLQKHPNISVMGDYTVAKEPNIKTKTYLRNEQFNLFVKEYSSDRPNVYNLAKDYTPENKTTTPNIYALLKDINPPTKKKAPDYYVFHNKSVTVPPSGELAGYARMETGSPNTFFFYTPLRDIFYETNYPPIIAEQIQQQRVAKSGIAEYKGQYVFGGKPSIYTQIIKDIKATKGQGSIIVSMASLGPIPEPDINSSNYDKNKPIWDYIELLKSEAKSGRRVVVMSSSKKASTPLILDELKKYGVITSSTTDKYDNNLLYTIPILRDLIKRQGNHYNLVVINPEYKNTVTFISTARPTEDSNKGSHGAHIENMLRIPYSLDPQAGKQFAKLALNQFYFDKKTATPFDSSPFISSIVLNRRLPYYPTQLADTYYQMNYGASTPYLNTFTNLNEYLNVTAPPSALVDMNIALSRGSIRHQINTVVGQNLLLKDMNFGGSVVQHVGRGLDYLFGYYDYLENKHEDKQPVKGTMRGMLAIQHEPSGTPEGFFSTAAQVLYNIPTGSAVAIGTYLSINLPLQHVKASLEQELLLSLITPKEYKPPEQRRALTNRAITITSGVGLFTAGVAAGMLNANVGQAMTLGGISLVAHGIHSRAGNVIGTLSALATLTTALKDNQPEAVNIINTIGMAALAMSLTSGLDTFNRRAVYGKTQGSVISLAVARAEVLAYRAKEQASSDDVVRELNLILNNLNSPGEDSVIRHKQYVLPQEGVTLPEGNELFAADEELRIKRLYAADNQLDAQGALKTSNAIDLGGDGLSYFSTLRFTRQLDKSRFDTIIRPILEAINPYEFGGTSAASHGRLYRVFDLAIHELSTTIGALPKLQLTGSSGKPNAQLLNVGQDRIAQMAKSLDRIGYVLPLNIAYWLPGMRQALGLNNFNPQQNLVWTDIFSMEEASHWVSSSARMFQGSIVPKNTSYSTGWDNSLGKVVEFAVNTFKASTGAIAGLGSSIVRAQEIYSTFNKVRQARYDLIDKLQYGNYLEIDRYSPAPINIPANADAPELQTLYKEVQQSKTEIYQKYGEVYSEILDSPEYKTYIELSTELETKLNAHSAHYTSDLNPKNVEDNPIAKSTQKEIRDSESLIIKPYNSEAFIRAQRTKKFVQYLGMALLTDAALGWTVLEHTIGLGTQIAARHNLRDEDDQAYQKFKLTNDPGVGLPLSVALVTGSLTGYIFPEYKGKSTLPIKEANINEVDTALATLNRAANNLNVALRSDEAPAAALAQAQAEYARLHSPLSRVEHSEVQFNKKLAWAGGLAGIIATRIISSAVSWGYSKFILNDTEGVELKGAEAVLSDHLRSYAMELKDTLDFYGDKGYAPSHANFVTLGLLNSFSRELLMHDAMNTTGSIETLGVTLKDGSVNTPEKYASKLTRVYNIATQLPLPFFQVSFLSRYEQGRMSLGIGFQLAPITGLGLNLNLPFSVIIRPTVKQADASLLDQYGKSQLKEDDFLRLTANLITGPLTFGSSFIYENNNSFVPAMATIGTFGILSSIIKTFPANRQGKYFVSDNNSGVSVAINRELNEIQRLGLNPLIRGAYSLAQNSLLDLVSLPFQFTYYTGKALAKGRVGRVAFAGIASLAGVNAANNYLSARGYDNELIGSILSEDELAARESFMTKVKVGGLVAAAGVAYLAGGNELFKRTLKGTARTAIPFYLAASMSYVLSRPGASFIEGGGSDTLMDQIEATVGMGLVYGTAWSAVGVFASRDRIAKKLTDSIVRRYEAGNFDVKRYSHEYFSYLFNNGKPSKAKEIDQLASGLEHSIKKIAEGKAIDVIPPETNEPFYKRLLNKSRSWLLNFNEWPLREIAAREMLDLAKQGYGRTITIDLSAEGISAGSHLAESLPTRVRSQESRAIKGRTFLLITSSTAVTAGLIALASNLPKPWRDTLRTTPIVGATLKVYDASFVGAEVDDYQPSPGRTLRKYWNGFYANLAGIFGLPYTDKPDPFISTIGPYGYSLKKQATPYIQWASEGADLSLSSFVMGRKDSKYTEALLQYIKRMPKHEGVRKPHEMNKYELLQMVQRGWLPRESPARLGGLSSYEVDAASGSIARALRIKEYMAQHAAWQTPYEIQQDLRRMGYMAGMLKDPAMPSLAPRWTPLALLGEQLWLQGDRTNRLSPNWVKPETLITKSSIQGYIDSNIYRDRLAYSNFGFTELVAGFASALSFSGPNSFLAPIANTVAIAGSVLTIALSGLTLLSSIGASMASASNVEILNKSYLYSTNRLFESKYTRFREVEYSGQTRIARVDLTKSNTRGYLTPVSLPYGANPREVARTMRKEHRALMQELNDFFTSKVSQQIDKIAQVPLQDLDDYITTNRTQLREDLSLNLRAKLKDILERPIPNGSRKTGAQPSTVFESLFGSYQTVDEFLDTVIGKPTDELDIFDKILTDIIDTNKQVGKGGVLDLPDIQKRKVYGLKAIRESIFVNQLVETFSNAGLVEIDLITNKRTARTANTPQSTTPRQIERFDSMFSRHSIGVPINPMEPWSQGIIRSLGQAAHGTTKVASLYFNVVPYYEVVEGAALLFDPKQNFYLRKAGATSATTSAAYSAVAFGAAKAISSLTKLPAWGSLVIAGGGLALTQMLLAKQPGYRRAESQMLNTIGEGAVVLADDINRTAAGKLIKPVAEGINWFTSEFTGPVFADLYNQFLSPEASTKNKWLGMALVYSNLLPYSAYTEERFRKANTLKGVLDRVVAHSRVRRGLDPTFVHSSVLGGITGDREQHLSNILFKSYAGSRVLSQFSAPAYRLSNLQVTSLKSRQGLYDLTVVGPSSHRINRPVTKKQQWWWPLALAGTAILAGVTLYNPRVQHALNTFIGKNVSVRLASRLYGTRAGVATYTLMDDFDNANQYDIGSRPSVKTDLTDTTLYDNGTIRLNKDVGINLDRLGRNRVIPKGAKYSVGMTEFAFLHEYAHFRQHEAGWVTNRVPFINTEIFGDIETKVVSTAEALAKSSAYYYADANTWDVNERQLRKVYELERAANIQAMKAMDRGKLTSILDNEFAGLHSTTSNVLSDEILERAGQYDQALADPSIKLKGAANAILEEDDLRLYSPGARYNGIYPSSISGQLLPSESWLESQGRGGRYLASLKRKDNYFKNFINIYKDAKGLHNPFANFVDKFKPPIEGNFKSYNQRIKEQADKLNKFTNDLTQKSTAQQDYLSKLKEKSAIIEDKINNLPANELYKEKALRQELVKLYKLIIKEQKSIVNNKKLTDSAKAKVERLVQDAQFLGERSSKKYKARVALDWAEQRSERSLQLALSYGAKIADLGINKLAFPLANITYKTVETAGELGVFKGIGWLLSSAAVLSDYGVSRRATKEQLAIAKQAYHSSYTSYAQVRESQIQQENRNTIANLGVFATNLLTGNLVLNVATAAGLYFYSDKISPKVFNAVGFNTKPTEPNQAIAYQAPNLSMADYLRLNKDYNRATTITNLPFNYAVNKIVPAAGKVVTDIGVQVAEKALNVLQSRASTLLIGGTLRVTGWSLKSLLPGAALAGLMYYKADEKAGLTAQWSTLSSEQQKDYAYSLDQYIRRNRTPYINDAIGVSTVINALYYGRHLIKPLSKVATSFTTRRAAVTIAGVTTSTLTEQVASVTETNVIPEVNQVGATTEINPLTGGATTNITQPAVADDTVVKGQSNTQKPSRWRRLFNKAEHPVEGAKTPTWWERLFNKAEPSVEEAKTPTWWERLFNKAEPSVEEAQTPTWWKRLFNRAEPPVEGDKTPTWWKRLFNKAATPTGRSATEVSALATNIPNRPVKQAKDLYDNSFIRAVRGLTGFGSNVVIGAGDVLSTGVDAARLVAGRPLDAVRLRASGLLARGAAFKGQGLMGGTLNKVGSILSDIGIKDVSLTTAAYAFDIINTVSSFNRLKAINKNSSLEDITADVVTYRRSSSSLLWNLTIDVTTQSYGSLASLFSIPLSKRYANTTDARKKATELYSKVQRGEEIDTFDLIESEHYIAGGTLIFVSGASLLERYYHKKLDVGYVNIRANQTKLEDLKVDNAKINLKTIEHKISDEYAKATPDKNEILRLEAEARSINEKLKVRPVEININEKHRAGIATRKREITSTTKAIETRRQRSIKYTSTTLDGLTGFAKFKAQVKNAWVGVGNSIRERHIQADINKLGQLQSEIIHLEQSNQPRTINVTGYFDANELEYSDQLFIKYRLGRLTRWAKQTFDSWLAKRKKAKPNNGLQTERFTIKEKFRALHQQATNIYNSRPGTGLDLIHSISIAEGRYTAGVDSIETAEDFLRNTQNSITERTTFFSVVNQLESEVATLSKYLPGPSYLPPALINIDSAFTEGANPPSINYMKANAANLSKTNQILAFTTDVTNKYGGSAFDSSDFVNEVKALQNETLNRLNNNKRVTGNLIKTFKQLEGFYKELTPSLQTAQEARSSIQAMELTPQEVKTELKGLDRITNLLFGRFDKQTKDYTSTDNKPVTLASFGNSIRTRLSNLSARFTSVSTSTTPTTPTIQTPITTPAPNDSALITSSSALNREQQELSTLVNQITEDSKGLFTTAVDEQGFFSFSGDERRSVQTVRGANPFALKIRSSIIKTFKAVIAPSKLSAYDRLQTQYGSTPFSGGVSGLGFGLFGSYLAATALRPVGYNLGLDISKGNEDVAEGIASLAQFTGGLAGGIGASAVGRQVMIRALDSSGAIRSIAKADYFASRSMSRNWSAVSNKVSAKLIAGGAGRLVQSTADMGLDYAIAAGIGVSGAVKVATADTEEERLSGFKRIGAASGAITVGTAFAVAGSFIPIPGATFVTGAIGSAVGDWLGSRLGEAIYYLTKPFRNELPTTTNIYTTNQLYKTDMALRRKDNIALDYIVKPVIKASRWVSKKLGYKDKYTTNYGPVIPVQSQTISPLAPIPQPVPHTNKVIPPTGGPLIPQGYMPHPVQIAFKKPDRRINSYVVNEQEKNLLYKLIYEEAKGESPLGRLAVANSILLRFSLIKSGTVTPGSYNIRKPASQVTITDVIKAKDQYQPYRTGKLNNTNMPTGDYNQIEGLVEGLLTKGNVQSFMDMGLTQEKAKHLAAMPNFRVKSDPTEATYYQRSRGLTIGNHRFAPDWLNGGGRPLSIFSSYYKTSANVPSTNVSTVDTTPKQPSIAITPSSQQRTGGTNYRERYKNAKFNPTVMAIIEHTFEGPHQKLLMQNVNRIDIRKDEKLSYGEAYFYYYPDTKKGGVYLDPKAYRELSSINTLTPETAETLSHELRHIQQYLQPALTGQPFVFITDINKIPKNKRSSILDLVNLSVSGTEDIINSRTISGLAPFDKSLQTKKELDAYIFTTIRTGDRERLLANLKQEYSIQGTNTDISKRTQVTPPPAVVTPAKTTLPPKGNRLNPTLSVIFSEVFDDKIEDSLMQYLPTIAVDKNLSPGSATYYEDSNTIKLDPQTFKAVQSIDTIKPEHISLLTHEAVHVQQNLSRKLKLKYTPDLDLSKLTKDQEAFVMNSAMTSTIEILSVGGTKNSQQALVDETEAYLFGFKHDSRIIANVYKSQGRKPIERRLGVSDLGLPPMPEIPGYTPATTPTAITSTIPPTTPTTPPIVPSKQPKRKETGIIVQTSPVYQLHLQDGEVFSVGDFTADTNTGEYTNGSSLYNKRDTDPIGYIVRPDERIMNNPRVTDLIQTQTRVSQSLNTSAQIISHDRALVTNAKFRSTYDSAQQAFTRYQTTGNFDDLKRAVELAGAARSIYDTPEVQSLLVQINGALTVKLSSTIDSLRPTYPNVTTTPIYKQGTQPTVTQPQTVSPIPQNNIVPLLPLGVDQQDNTGSIFNKPPEITTTPTVVTKPPTEVHKYIIPNERFGKAYLSTYGARKTTLQDLGFVGWSGDLPKDIAESNRLWVAGSKTLSPAELHHLAKERLQLGKQFFANKPNTKTFLDALQKDVDVTGAIYNAVKADTIIQTATTKEQLLQAKTLYQSSNVTFFKYNNQWNKYFNVQITSISNTIEYNTQAVQLAQQQQVQQQQQQQRNTLITNKLDTARINSRLHGNQTRITRPLDPNKDGFSIKFSNSLIQQMYNKHIYSKDVNLAVSPLAVERKLAQQKLDALIAYAIQNGLPESDINKLVQLNNTIDRSLPANYNQATALKIRQRVITLNTEIQRLSTLKQGDQASTAAPLYSKVVQQYNSLRAIDPNGQYFNIPTSFTTAYNMSVAGLRKTTPLINFDSYLQNSETGRRILHLEGTVVGPYKQRVDNAIDPNAGLTINQAFKKEGVGYSRLSASLTEAQNQWLSLKGQKSNRDQSGRPIISNEFIDDKIAQIETLKGANQFNALAKVNESLDYARDLLKDKDNYNQVGSIIRNVINPITGYAVQARGLSNVYDEKANELAKSSYQLGFETAITTARAYHTLGDERMAAYLASRKKNIKESQLHISVTPTKGNDGPRFSLGYIGAFTAYDEIQSYYLNALSLYNIRLTSPDGKASLQAYQIGVNQRLQTDNRNELNRRVNSTNGSIRKERDRLYTNLTNVQNSLKGQLASLTRAVETHDSKLLQSNLKTTFGNTNVANVFTALKAIKAGQSATLVLDINSPVGQLFALDPERGFTYLTNYLNVYAATGNPDWQATTTNKLIKTQLDRSYGILSKFIGSSLVKNQDGSLRPVTALPVPWSIDRDAVIDYTPGQRISQEVYKRIKNKVAGQDLWEVTYSNTLSTTGYSFLDGLRGDQRSGDSAKEARRRDRLAAAAGTPVSILAFMTSRALDNKTNVLDDRFAVPLGDGHYELVKVGDVFERLVDGNKADRWLQYHYMTAVRTNQVFVPGQSIPSKVTVGLYNSYNYQEEAYQFLSYSTAKFQNAVGPNVFGLKLGKTLDSLGRVFNTVSGVLGAFAPVVGVSYAQTNNKQNQGVPINVMQYVTDLNRGTITSFFNNPNNPHLLPLVNKLGFLFKNDGHTAQVDPTLLTASGVGKVNNPINSLKPGTVISNRTLRFDNTFISLTTYFDPFTYDVIGAGGLTSGKPLSRQQQLTAIRGAATINLLYAISNLDAYTVATRQVTGNLALNTLRSFLGLPGATIDMGIGLAVTGLQLILTKASQNPQDLARAIKKIKEIQNQGGITINGVSAPDGKAPHNLNNNFGGGFNRKVPQNDFTDFGDDIRLFNEQDLKVPDSKRKANEKDVSYNKVNETDQQDVFNEKVKATTKEVEQALKVAKEAYSTQYKVEIPFDKNPDFAHVIGNAVAKAEQKYATSDNVPEIKIANGKVQIDVYNEDKYVNEMFAVANGYANNPLAHVI